MREVVKEACLPSCKRSVVPRGSAPLCLHAVGRKTRYSRSTNLGPNG